MADSTVTIVGNLTRDPELRFTQGGRAICTLGIAVSRRYQVNNEWKEDTSFFNVVAWGQLGENAASSLTKGTRVVASGRLEQRSYEAQGGEKKSVVEIVADEIGPSLRWASAQVDRNERRDGASGGGEGRSQGGGNSGGGSGSGQSGAPRGGSSNDPVYGDEEPF
jgi:single-strand DNA-binding protein